MGLCGGKEANALERPGQGILSVWGDPFQSETRTIMAVIKLGGIPHEFHAVDSFKGEQRNAEYLKVNPTG